MGKLMYSSSAELMTLAEIKMLPKPESQGPHHHPYPFFDYITDVKDAMELQGMMVMSEEYALQHDGQQLFGVLEVEVPGITDVEDKEWKLLVGIRGSHDRTVSRGLVIGSQIMVCDNLCFSGAISLRTKQTTHVEERIPDLIHEAVSQIPKLAKIQNSKLDQYKGVELRTPWKEKALVELFREGALSGNQLPIAIQELFNPSYEEHGEFDGTVYGLMQACTQALKPTGTAHNPATAADRSIKLSKHLDRLAGTESLDMEAS